MQKMVSMEKGYGDSSMHHLFPGKLIIGFFLCFFLFACSSVQQKVCVKDGNRYCVTSDKIHVINWDSCYRRGVHCMEGECWDYAINEFRQAIQLRYEDQRFVRAYGMRFREEYFPHRELGICYFRMGNIEDALRELELSMRQTPSARAKYYLNQSHRSYLISTGLDMLPPTITLETTEAQFLTNTTPLKLKGVINDDRYVAAVSINQQPLFIELAEASLPFQFPVALHEGWNTIHIAARDLVDRETDTTLQVYLDQQGPIVIVKPLKPERGGMGDQALITAAVYDRSGVASFTLNRTEVSRIGLDQICLIEQHIPLVPGIETIPFRTEDHAGNITEGVIDLSQGKRRSNANAIRFASKDFQLISTAMETEGDDISFDMTNPPQENFITCYDDIFLEGRIETKNGIRGIEINHQQFFNLSEIESAVNDTMKNLVQMLEKQNKEPERYIHLLREIIRQNTIYYINQKIPLTTESLPLDLIVEDITGKTGTKHYFIKKIPREEIFPSEQRMLLALLPFDIIKQEETSIQPYIYNKFIESVIRHARFNLVEREKLPWVLIEKTIQSGGKMYSNDAAQEIGQMAAADGVICGYIRKRGDGTEILARFVEVDTGIVRLFQDVFTPSDNIENLNIITTGLSMKFRDSFPLCVGAIINQQGKTFQVNVGSEKGIFPGMGFNIFRDEKELISKASIREVEKEMSEAEIDDDEKIKGVEVGYKVRTR